VKNLIPLALAMMTTVATAAPSPQPADQKTSSIHCSFTEPFFGLDFDLKKREVSRTEPDWKHDSGKSITKVIAKGIRVRTDMSDPFVPKYKVLTSSGKVLAELTLDVQGSDGMSDIISPFSIKFANLLGGCSSNRIKAIHPDSEQQ
jgi:hypothetical protein